jgi:WD40 repeat protein
LLHTLRGHAGEVNAVVFSANGSAVVSAGEDGKVIVWDTGSGRQVQALTGHGAPVRSLALSQDGSLLAGGGADGQVLVWDMATGAVSREVGGQGGAANVVAFDRSDKSRLFVGDDQDAVVAWKLSAR